MSKTALENLRRDWPKRHALTREEVAVVLGRNSNSRGVLQKIREGMKSGRYPGARKIDGHWQLPLEDLAEILDPTPETVMVPVVAKAGRRRSQVGPRIRFVINARFFAQVCDSIGYAQGAQALRNDAWTVREELRQEDYARRAERSKMSLVEALAGLGHTKDD
ncbi:hypothetical protein [Stenotrophomonas maltophilia]|uniref:hypothetical protein n=1 Tax=Stenotrophomonas maltophilia TaxID=40324 RepID=UPI0028E241D6|nr:hypothetical protein [Stenotrophomonas maltophilia]WNV16767.1 hypothetical protein RS400_09565 [Stenotrophomonas maltophilia]